MTGYCAEISLCIGAAIQGNCSAGEICCAVDTKIESAMRRRFDLKDDTLTKVI